MGQNHSCCESDSLISGGMLKWRPLQFWLSSQYPCIHSSVQPHDSTKREPGSLLQWHSGSQLQQQVPANLGSSVPKSLGPGEPKNLRLNAKPDLPPQRKPTSSEHHITPSGLCLGGWGQVLTDPMWKLPYQSSARSSASQQGSDSVQSV